MILLSNERGLFSSILLTSLIDNANFKNAYKLSCCCSSIYCCNISSPILSLTLKILSTVVTQSNFLIAFLYKNSSFFFSSISFISISSNECVDKVFFNWSKLLSEVVTDNTRDEKNPGW